MTTVQQAPARCPKCDSRIISPTHDGDFTCHNGHTIYVAAAPRIVVYPIEPERPLLSPRQTEMLAYIAEGATNREMAQRMGVTMATWKKRLRGM